MAFLRASTAACIRHGISMLTMVVLLLSMAGLTGWLRLQMPPEPTRVTTLHNDGPGSLRWAIENAPAGSTITFETSLKGTLLLTSDDLHISKRLHIHGPRAGRVTISGGQNDFGLDVLPAGSGSIISDLTFQESYIDSEGGTLTLINSVVSGNRTIVTQVDDGGAIYNNGTLTLISSTVSGNTASHNGGAIFNKGTLTLTNSTISTNTAATFGGAIANHSGPTQTEITFCTIYGNTASNGGGGIWNDAHNGAGQLVMRNSLVAGNRAAHSPDIVGQLTSEGYNLIENTEGTVFALNELHATDLLQVPLAALRIDPRLQDNNGPTQTLALLPGSLAVHRIPFNACHVEGISTDQRGVRRPQGVACDIGAYELLG